MKIIGVDIGGTGIKSALVECVRKENASSYRILSKSSVPTDAKGGRDRVIENIRSAVDKYIADCDGAVIGVGSAGDVDDKTGVITYATESLPGFTGLDLRGLLVKRYGRRVTVINDAVAALIGEAYTAEGLGERPMMLTLGTGLGCAVINDVKEPLGSGSVENIRLGHICLHEGGRTCACGLRGCAEQYVSATALKKNAGTDSVKEILSNGLYKDAVDKFSDDFGNVLQYAMQTYSPSSIIIGGGVVELAEFWWDKLLAKCGKETAGILIKAKLGNDAALIGSVYAAAVGDYGLQNEI